MIIPPISPKDYEYLWSDHDVNFIFTSCYLFPTFRKTDIILIYLWEKKELQFFLAKKDHNLLSQEGVLFYQQKFPVWEYNIQKLIIQGRNLIQETKKHTSTIYTMTLKELKQHFLKRVTLFQELGELYFYTEFFVVDGAEKLVKEDPKKYELLKKNLALMGTIKLQAREVLNEFYNYTHLFQLYVKEMAKRTNRIDLPWLSYDQIINAVDGEGVPVSILDNTNWVVAKKTGWNVLQRKEADILQQSFHSFFFTTNTNQISGIVANKGKCQGNVKIIRTMFSDNIIEEIKKVHKGDILVANTTGPEIMIACTKAAAIVTDEGGMTSHAAIVSRELKIPCIVGTKIATKVFKDGDLVEVDATKGIVKLLKT